MVKVYIAGAYSASNTLDILNNIRKGIRTGIKLLLEGYCPFIPFLDFNIFLLLKDDEYINIDMIQRYSIEWLKVCDAIIVLDNYKNSTGTQKEIEYANKLKIPVFYSLKDLKKCIKKS